MRAPHSGARRLLVSLVPRRVKSQALQLLVLTPLPRLARPQVPSLRVICTLFVFFSVLELDSDPIVRFLDREIRLLVLFLLQVEVLAVQHQVHRLCALVQHLAMLIVSQSVLNFDWSRDCIYSSVIAQQFFFVKFLFDLFFVCECSNWSSVCFLP